MAKVTVINVNVDDQFLEIKNQPTIASNQSGFTKAHFDINDDWAGLTVKAMFKKDVQSATCYYASLTNGECTIPSAVLDAAGNVAVAIFSVPASGTDVKTSTVDYFKVVAGATVEVVQAANDNDDPDDATA